MTTNTKCSSILTLVVIAAHSAVALAEQLPESSAAPPAEPSVLPAAKSPVQEADSSPGVEETRTDAVWLREYANARKKLYDGELEAAEREFERLSQSTTNDRHRQLARELALLIRVWRSRGMRLVLGTAREAKALTSRETERTSDELATLYLASVGYGLGTGAWLAVQTEPKSAAAGVLPALGLAGVAAAGVALADARGGLKYGVPQSITTGLALGLAEGGVWALWNQSRVNSSDEWDDKTLANVIWGSATFGAVAGGVVGTLAGTTPGRASFVGSSGLWTGAISGLVAASFSGDENDERDDNALLAGAIGLNAGAVGGALLAGPVSPSVARVRFIDLGGIAGGVLAGGIHVSATDGLQEGDAGKMRGFFGTTALGIAVGLGAAAYFTRGMERDERGKASAMREATEVSAEPTLMAAPGGAMLGAVGSW